MEIISRAEAKAKGLKRYFTGKPCKHGHVSWRDTHKSRCATCNIENVKRYTLKNHEQVCTINRARYARDKDKIKARRFSDPSWYEKKKERQRLSYHRNKHLHKDRVRDYGKKYRAAHLEKIREKRKRYQTRHGAELSKKSRARYVKNRQKALERTKNYRAKIFDLLAFMRVEMPDLLKEFGL